MKLPLRGDIHLERQFSCRHPAAAPKRTRRLYSYTGASGAARSRWRSWIVSRFVF